MNDKIREKVLSVNGFEKIIHFLQWEMETPQMYGWFHLASLGAVVLAVFLLCRFARNAEGRKLDMILRCFAISCIVLEIYKQLVFSFDYNAETGVAVWDFQWYAFPFQFCSTPMYIALAASFLKEGKVKNALLAYLATFGMLAGLLVMAYPSNVFIGTIGINIQTMYHHGGQAVIGLYLLACRKIEMKWSSMLGASAVFVSLMCIALSMNVCAELSGLRESFNMFYIRYGETPSLPVYDMLYPDVLSYPVFLMLYAVPFIGASCGIFALGKAAHRKAA